MKLIDAIVIALAVAATALCLIAAAPAHSKEANQPLVVAEGLREPGWWIHDEQAPPKKTVVVRKKIIKKVIITKNRSHRHSHRVRHHRHCLFTWWCWNGF